MTTCAECGDKIRVRTSRDCGNVQERRHECRRCKRDYGKTYEPRSALRKCCKRGDQT